MPEKKNGIMLNTKLVVFVILIISAFFGMYGYIMNDVKGITVIVEEKADLKYYSKENGHQLENVVSEQTAILKEIKEDIKEIKEKIR